MGGGGSLPKAVDSTVVERHESKGFRVGNAELNGWRTNMEDSHLIMLRENWGFFGIFDGHGGAACAAWVAQRIREEIEKDGCPQDDAAAKELCLKVDQAWLDKDESSGSTAAMCIVHKPAGGGKHRLHVINAGDSRVMLGKRDGSIVDGGGKCTDQGLTRDHKPDDPEERERIYRCGGTVAHEEGNCARVNGNLAVSRGFGDKDEKKTGPPGDANPSLEDRPVTANPECGHFECDEGDILFLVCDGVSEGEFPNPEVVKFAAQLFREDNDLGAAARAVCHKAVEMKSQDNVSCMLVTMDGLDSAPAESPEPTVEFTPGSVSKLGNKGYRTAYEDMAKRAGFTLVQAVAKRYEILVAELKKEEEATLVGAPDGADGSSDLQEEATLLGTPDGAAGSAEREAWCDGWLQALPEEKEEDPMGGMDMASMMGGKGGGMGGMDGMMGGKGGGKGGKGGKEAPPVKDLAEHEEKGYTWNQNGEEIQIAFKLPKKITKKEVKVAFKPTALQVNVEGMDSLFDGQLKGKIDLDDCNWCLVDGGTELQIMLTKVDGKDWSGLLK